MSVHVYQRVDTLAALDTLLRVRPDQRLLAVPLRLDRGELLRQRLPPVEGANCQAHFLNAPRRWRYLVGPGATVTVYRPLDRGAAPPATGYLLVRWPFS